ncbi:hypothetical protein [Clostridium grantii]|uniref:Uncharacterized protein n=1 Tax=Clostridium grantii DSM 8605 TaxID=1121316 RepID=A0A1M5UQ71_9CLOT|nr:hypothetical protein [Clostridium grantii]SHH65074.1 hypothetical protein SAMN02745207_01877 [Clostridium grantii DSM 8605]
MGKKDIEIEYSKEARSKRRQFNEKGRYEEEDESEKIYKKTKRSRQFEENEDELDYLDNYDLYKMKI